MVSTRTLMQVQSQNWRDHGGNGDVDPEVMHDLGFPAFDEFDVVIDAARRAKLFPHHADPTTREQVAEVAMTADMTQTEPLIEMPDRVRHNYPSSLSPAQAREGMSEEEAERQQAINGPGADAARLALGKPRAE